MGCIKSKEFHWCKDLPIVAEGCCLFHVRSKLKGMTVEAFNERVFERIIDSKKKGEKCDLSGTVFPGRIDFEKFDTEYPLPSISFSSAQFDGDAYFADANFNEEQEQRIQFINLGHELSFTRHLPFASVHFAGTADFKLARFTKRAYFSKAHFDKDVTFTNTNFTGKAHFEYARFNEGADFDDATFNEEAKFSNTTFRNSTDFCNSLFKSNANFDNAVFETADFSHAKFNKTAVFRICHFFNTANFFSTVFDDRAFFQFTRFRKRVYFAWTLFNSTADFTGKTFYADGIFNRVFVKQGLHFRDTDLSHVSFWDTNFDNVEFVNTHWREEHGRYILHDEIEAQKATITASSLKIMITKIMSYYKPLNVSELAQVKSTYNKLKRKCRKEQNESEASKWHYGEKEMQRRATGIRSPFQFIAINLYWLSCGYSEAPIRALAVLLVLLIAFSLLLISAGLVPFDSSGYAAREISSITSIGGIKGFLTVLYSVIQYATFQKQPFLIPQRGDLWGWYIRLFCQILIPIQTALLILSIRNRFRR